MIISLLGFFLSGGAFVLEAFVWGGFCPVILIPVTGEFEPSSWRGALGTTLCD